jgi:prepilin-type N-terminal cleavage/methylation domain-containing protein
VGGGATETAMLAPSHTRGFTLLEVVVVLVIVSMTAALAFPRLSVMAASFTFATERDQFEQTLNGLPYTALRSSSDQILLGTYTETGRDTRKQPSRSPGDTLDPSLRTTSLLANAREHLPPVNASFAAVPLPSGWQMEVTEPIYYRTSGFCTGGRINLFIGRVEYTYQLRPPLCRAELVE